jgi:hypothetical protein
MKPREHLVIKCESIEKINVLNGSEMVLVVNEVDLIPLMNQILLSPSGEEIRKLLTQK